MICSLRLIGFFSLTRKFRKLQFKGKRELEIYLLCKRYKETSDVNLFWGKQRQIFQK